MNRVRSAARKLRDHPGIIYGAGGTFPDGRIRLHVRDLRAHDVLEGTKHRVLSIGPVDGHEIDFYVTVADDSTASTARYRWHGASLITIMPRKEK